MKILVTGGAGFIGTNLVKRLVSEGNMVYSLDNYSTGLKSNHVEGCVYIEGDIEDSLPIGDFEYDVCYHLAAQSRVQTSFLDPSNSFKTNVKGTECVMEWARKNKVKVIYAGSSSKHHNPSDSPYAMYKYLGEEVCKLYKESYNVDVRIARFYNVYGTGETLDEINGNVIGIWRSKLSNNKPLDIVGDGEQRRDFTHVTDIVDGLIKICDTRIIHEDAWELGTGVNYSVNELYDMFLNRYSNITKNNIPDQKGNYRSTLNINTDAKDQLRWNSSDKLKDYINTLL